MQNIPTVHGTPWNPLCVVEPHRNKHFVLRVDHNYFPPPWSVKRIKQADDSGRPYTLFESKPELDFEEDADINFLLRRLNDIAPAQYSDASFWEDNYWFKQIMSVLDKKSDEKNIKGRNAARAKMICAVTAPAVSLIDEQKDRLPRGLKTFEEMLVPSLPQEPSSFLPLQPSVEAPLNTEVYQVPPVEDQTP